VAREIHKDKCHKDARADRMTQETHRDKFPEIPLKIRPQIKQNNRGSNPKIPYSIKICTYWFSGLYQNVGIS